MNDQLISLSDESLDQVAGGALISLNVTGTLKSLVGAAASIGEAACGLGSAVVKTGNTVVKTAIGAVGQLVDIK
jgi:hypothetical protein